MNIFEWINSDDGPQFDDDLGSDHGPDDYAGVVRWDGKRKSRGDRDDLEAKREQDEIEESIKRIKRRQRDFDLLYQDQISKPTPKPSKRTLLDSGYGQVPEGQKSNYREAHEASANRRLDDAIAEGQASRPNPRIDPISNTSPGYVVPHEKYNNGFGFLLLVVFVGAAIITLLTGG